MESGLEAESMEHLDRGDKLLDAVRSTINKQGLKIVHLSISKETTLSTKKPKYQFEFTVVPFDTNSEDELMNLSFSEENPE